MRKNERIFGVSAAYPKQLLRRAFERIIIFSVLAFIAAAISLMLIMRSNSYDRVFSLLGFTAAFFAFFQIVAAKVKVDTALAGIKAEEMVSSKIEKYTNFFLIKGAMFKANAGDIDHIIVGNKFAVIETKNGRGLVTHTRQGKLAINGKEMYRSPLIQARKQAQHLSKLTGVNVTPILCIINAENSPLKIEGVQIVNISQLPDILASLPEVLTPEQSQEMVKFLLSKQLN